MTNFTHVITLRWRLAQQHSVGRHKTNVCIYALLKDYQTSIRTDAQMNKKSCSFTHILPTTIKNKHWLTPRSDPLEIQATSSRPTCDIYIFYCPCNVNIYAPECTLQIPSSELGCLSWSPCWADTRRNIRGASFASHSIKITSRHAFAVRGKRQIIIIIIRGA